MSNLYQGFSVNPFDAAVVIILAIFGITSFMRGFTASALMLMAWGGSFIGTGYVSPFVLPYVSEIIQQETVASGITYAITFILLLLVLKLIARLIGRIVRDSNVGSLDRAMGLLFGLFGGMALISALYMITTPFISEKNQPDWFINAKSRPLIQYGASMISAINPYFDKINMDEKRKDVEALERMKKMIPSFPTKQKTTKSDEAYKSQNQEEMNKLFEKLSKE